MFLDDALLAMEEMIGNAHSVLLHSTEMIDGLVELLPEKIRNGVIHYHQSDKKKPGAFNITRDMMAAKGARIISHSEDDVAVLTNALTHEHFQNNNGLVVYVERNNKFQSADILAKGIHMHVNKLTEVPYKELAKYITS